MLERERDGGSGIRICQSSSVYVPSSWELSNGGFCAAGGRGRLMLMLCSVQESVDVQAVFHHYGVQRSELIISLM